MEILLTIVLPAAALVAIYLGVRYKKKSKVVAQIIEELDEALVYSDIVLALLPPSKNKDNLVKILDIVKTAVNAINDKNPDLGEAEKLVLIEKTVKASLEKLGHPEALNEELIIKTIQKVLSKSE
jgi:hypothetical protein